MSAKIIWTQNQLEEAVKTSTSLAQVLHKLGFKQAGGSQKNIKILISSLGLDTSHFTGQAWNKGKILGPKRPIEDYLVFSEIEKISSYKLKLRLIKEGFFERKCYSCNQTEWLGQPIPLELEHKNGNHKDNSLANLTILCPNCHALTPTHSGKNKRLKRQQRELEPN